MKQSADISILPIIGNSQKLDGGAMFGHVPKSIWNRWYKTDDQNRIHLATRALLIRTSNHIILLETGIGAFFPPELKERYGVFEEKHILRNNLEAQGISLDDIDYVILSHLHFDHAGGLLSAWEIGQENHLLFNKSKFVVSKKNWDRANNPHERDKASFLPKLNKKLIESNRLVLVNNSICSQLPSNFQFIFSEGHTPGLMHAIYTDPSSGEVIIFASDLIPAKEWVHLPITMGYDRNAELVIDEKKSMLEIAIEKDAYIFFTHDPDISMAKITKHENKKYSIYDAVENSVN